MTSFDTDIVRCGPILDQILGDISEEHLVRLVDDPIDAAVERYAPVVDRPQCLTSLIDEVARFCVDLRQHSQAHDPNGDRGARSEADSGGHRDEAMDMLQQFYIGTHADGLFAAYLDAVDESQPGTAHVIERLAARLKEHARAVHVRRCLARHIDPGDWCMRAGLAGAIMRSCGDLLPRRMANCAPDQLADQLPLLLGLLQSITTNIVGIDLANLAMSPEMP